jgi:branched-chain amino acid transport system ATP-binding protein
VRRGIALVPENRLVFPSMTVLENLQAGAYQRSDGIDADVERVYERFPRLKERASQQAGTLSGGEQQMLAVARALMSRPRLLLMDEPSLGLAPLVVEEIFRTIAELHRDGTTIFVVEQNAHMALKLAQHFFLMEQGRITFQGTPGELRVDHAEHPVLLIELGDRGCQLADLVVDAGELCLDLLKLMRGSGLRDQRFGLPAMGA